MFCRADAQRGSDDDDAAAAVDVVCEVSVRFSMKFERKFHKGYAEIQFRFQFDAPAALTTTASRTRRVAAAAELVARLYRRETPLISHSRTEFTILVLALL